MYKVTPFKRLSLQKTDCHRCLNMPFHCVSIYEIGADVLSNLFICPSVIGNNPAELLELAEFLKNLEVNHA